MYMGAAQMQVQLFIWYGSYMPLVYVHIFKERTRLGDLSESISGHVSAPDDATQAGKRAAATTVVPHRLTRKHEHAPSSALVCMQVVPAAAAAVVLQ